MIDAPEPRPPEPCSFVAVEVDVEEHLYSLVPQPQALAPLPRLVARESGYAAVTLAELAALEQDRAIVDWFSTFWRRLRAPDQPETFREWAAERIRAEGWAA